MELSRVLNLLRIYFNLKIFSEWKMYLQSGGAFRAQISIL